MQKRGLSDIVTTVLIILVALAAVVIIWNFLQPVLRNGGVNTDQFTTQLRVPEGSVSIDPSENLAHLKIDRQAGEGDISGFIVGLTSPNGSIKTFRTNITVKQLEVNNLTVNYTDAGFTDIVSISVTPIFKNNETGKEVFGNPIVQPVKNKTATYKLPSGLVAHWRMDGNWNDDRSGINGGAIGSANFDYTNLKVGLASATFPGASTSYMSVPNNALLNTNQFTVIAWINPRSLTAFSTTNLLDKSSLSSGFLLYYDLSTNTWKFFTRGTSNYLNISEQNSLDNWNFVAATMDSSGQKNVYLNSNSASTITPSYVPSTSTTTLRIGQYLNGNIDEVLFFNRALTPQEIQDIRTKYKG